MTASRTRAADWGFHLFAALLILVVGVLSFILLSSFTRPAPTPTGTWVQLEDGTAVMCVYLDRTGIECDWETRSVNQ